MSTIAVIAHAGKSIEGGLPQLRRTLEEAGVEVPIWYEVPKSRKAPKQVKRALKQGADLLVVWGGDGMVQRCIDAMDGSDATLAIVPAGTANLFASNLGVPKDIEGAVRVALSGHTRAVDVARMNGERFAVMAGAGFDAEMIRSADGGLKDRLGRVAYIVTGARAVRSPAVSRRRMATSPRSGPVIPRTMASAAASPSSAATTANRLAANTA